MEEKEKDIGTMSVQEINGERNRQFVKTTLNEEP